MSTPLLQRGSFAEVSLPRLLVQIHQERLGGTLEASLRRVTKRFRLALGSPIEVESSRESETLVSQLAETGRLAPADCDRVRAHSARRGGKEATALLQLRLLSPREVLIGLQEQVRRALMECFTWTEGGFSLEPDHAETPLPPVRNDLLAVVLQGLEAHWRPERLLATLGPEFARYVVCHCSGQRAVRWMARDEAGAQLIKTMDGSRTLEDALRQPDPMKALRLAWILDAASALECHDTPRSHDEESENTDEAEPQGEASEMEIVIESARGGGDKARPAPDSRGRASSGVPRATSPSPDIVALRREIEEKHARLGELDHYGILGIERDASDADVKRAYFAAAKRFHPDGLARLGLEDLHGTANEVFAQIATARDVLADPTARREYDATLDGGEQIDGTRLVQAETLFRKGEILLRAGNFRGAVEFFQPAVELWPMEAIYQAHLGWALLRRAPSDPTAARNHLERAVALDPRLAQAHFWLGAVLNDLGERDAAARAVARARQLDPSLR